MSSLAIALPAMAEEEEKALTPEDGWQLASDINLTLTQNAYSDNWEGGETGALSWALNSNTLAERQLTDVVNSKSTLKLAFGQTHSQDRSSKQLAQALEDHRPDRPRERPAVHVRLVRRPVRVRPARVAVPGRRATPRSRACSIR